MGIDVRDLIQGEPARMVSIESILSLPYSIDSYWADQNDGGNWIDRVDYKRADSHYAALKKSLDKRGNITPVTVKMDKRFNDKDVKDELVFGDGHHRLLAAIELGWTEILCAFPANENGWTFAVSPISGSWRKDGDGETGSYGIDEIEYRERLLKGTLESVS